MVVGCAFGELAVAAQRIPALGPGSLREDPDQYRQCGKGTAVSGPPDRLEESENDRTVAADCADLSA